MRGRAKGLGLDEDEEKKLKTSGQEEAQQHVVEKVCRRK